MKAEIIEIILVCIIIVIQIIIFIDSINRIILYKGSVINVTDLKIQKIIVPLSTIENLSPQMILNQLSKYKKLKILRPEHLELIQSIDGEIHQGSNSCNYIEESKCGEITIIESTVKVNPIFEAILTSTNHYLIRNRIATNDFNLIKDIVERNVGAAEEEINQSVSIPLYLGLMGTMIGIVIGLFCMPNLESSVAKDISTDILLNKGISSLIGGVKIAMIASFVGLLLTVINSGWFFRGARVKIESQKNKYYTFLQVELLPSIGQDFASTINSLQQNLLKFNSEFSSNLGQLTGIFNSNSQAIKAQKELIDTLERAKISDITRYNVDVLQKMETSLTKLDQFNKYLQNLNGFVDNSQKIIVRTDELLDRSNSIKIIAEKIESNLAQSEQLMEFLTSHFSQLESHKEHINQTVSDVGFSISGTFKELEQHIVNSSETVKQFTIDEIDALKKALAESKTSLSNLEHLSGLKTELSSFKENHKNQVEELNKQVLRSNDTLVKISQIVTKISDKKTFFMKAWNTIRKI